ncbi:MAG: ubiquitin-like protein Pup [Kocuria sp.]|nr:ubiquitin-like protein Pup [Kocuria sp.]
MAQERITSTGSAREEETALPEPTPTPAPGGPSAAAAQAQVAQADDLLADIDAVLESNAEEFVKGFVQKGGQ